MKPVFFSSGVLLALLLALAFAGVIAFHDRSREALAEGNAHYAAADYGQALDAYREGLAHRGNDPALRYNAGQAAFYAGDYAQAVDFYDQAQERQNTYLQSGNASLALGDAAEDGNEKLRLYKQALETYKRGIVAFPEDLALKYNYEYVLDKLRQEQEQQEQQEQQEGEDGGEQDQEQDGEGEDGDDGQQDENDQPGETESSGDEQNGEGEQGGSSPDDASASDPSREELEQIMQMLERQEEDSLKRNQEIKEQGTGDAYDW